MKMNEKVFDGPTVVSSYHRGYKVFADQDGDGIYSIWKYSDGSLVTESKYRPCPKCGELPTKDGHDHCIDNLPGVEHACCGHGMGNGYIKMFGDKNIHRIPINYTKEDILKLIEDINYDRRI